LTSTLGPAFFQALSFGGSFGSVVPHAVKPANDIISILAIKILFIKFTLET
jgi:hypothetical protein